MSARIPYLLTHLLNSDDCDAFRTEILNRVGKTTGDADSALLDAVILFDKMRAASFERRSKATPSARRKSLGLRLTR